MTSDVDPIRPPADVPEIQRGNWFSLPPDDPVLAYWVAEHGHRGEEPGSWQVARLSHAVYLYREVVTGSAMVAKYYAVKSHSSAEAYAAQEFALTQQAQSVLTEGAFRAVRPLAHWRGVLFLEYVNGLTLEDTIAVRRNQPGQLLPSLARTAALLARLHTAGTRSDVVAEFETPVAYAHQLVDELAKYGVLQGDPLLCDGLHGLIGRWAENASMRDYVPVLCHGDATTSNFVFPERGGVVAIDWERMSVADAAADLGRLIAEVSHSMKQHGGSVAEALPFLERIEAAYCGALPSHWYAEALVERTRFFRATSTLRIARNGWISRLDRTALVAQAFALLSSGN